MEILWFSVFEIHKRLTEVLLFCFSFLFFLLFLFFLFFICVFTLLQGKENIERLEITGVGDPSGRGLGFSYVRTVVPKAPMSSAMMKKKATAGRGGPTVTGTDADLRRLSMEAAREVCHMYWEISIWFLNLAKSNSISLSSLNFS